MWPTSGSWPRSARSRRLPRWVAVVLIFGAAGFARTDSGADTPADAGAAEKPPAVTYKPGSGLDIKLDRFELRIGVRLQVRASSDRQEYCGDCRNVLGTQSTTDVSTGMTTASNLAPSSTILGNATTGEDLSTASLAVRRVKPYFQGWAFDPRFKYDVQFESNPGGGSSNLGIREAFVDLQFTHQVQLQIGQWKGPYGRQRYISDGRQQFVDLSVATSAESWARVEVSRGQVIEYLGLPVDSWSVYRLALEKQPDNRAAKMHMIWLLAHLLDPQAPDRFQVHADALGAP